MLLALLAPTSLLPVGVRVVTPGTGTARVAVSMYGDRFNILDDSDGGSQQQDGGSQQRVGGQETRLSQGQGYGSDSVYQRERGDTAPIDVARVESLIAERSVCLACAWRVVEPSGVVKV